VSNLYEEIIYRGLLFCAFYGAAAVATFPLAGKVDRVGAFVAIVGSSVVFAAGHTQYSLAVRVGVGIAGIIFTWPWIRTRSLWAPWLVHTLTDVISDSIVKL
jgi:membrane protease YdiL (CAAX protease family)